MILNLKDLTILTIPIALKIHEINSDSVGRALRGDWFDGRFFNCLRREVTNRAPRNNPLDVLKSDTIVPFKDSFVCLLNPCFFKSVS
jgi:hypothetical protein